MENLYMQLWNLHQNSALNVKTINLLSQKLYISIKLSILIIKGF